MELTATKDRKRRLPLKWIGGGVVLLLILFLAVGAVRRQSGATAVSATTGDIVTVTTGDLSASATASGRVTAVSTANLAVNAPGVVEAILVEAGQTVAAGDPLVQLDTTDLAFQVERAEQSLQLAEIDLEALLDGASDQDIASAEAAVASAQVNLDNLLAGPTAQDIAASEASIRSQQASVASANAAYGSTLDSVSDSAIAAAEAALINAQIAYDSAVDVNEDDPTEATHNAMMDAASDLAAAQANLDALLDGPNQGSVTNASANVASAAANVDQAEANHDTLLAGATAQQIAAAEATLAQAAANLARLTDSATEQDILIAEAAVEQATLRLADAEEALAKATITAPYGGMITAVHVNVGEYATGNAVEIVSNTMQVVLSVDEVDIGTLAVGQAAQITLETWPNTPINAELTAIAPSATQNSDLVTYDVTLTLADSDLPILVGMTANAELFTASRTDVLLVPNAAINADRAAGTFTVNLVTGEADGQPVTEPVVVTVGLKDNQFTQITSGLSAGDELLIGTLNAPVIRFDRQGAGE